jgi:hypothetical protein
MTYNHWALFVRFDVLMVQEGRQFRIPIFKRDDLHVVVYK